MFNLFNLFNKNDQNSKIGIKGKITAVLRDADGNIKKIIETHNIVTNEGDTFYAQKACGETPTYAFTNLVLGSKAVPTTSKTSTYDSITVIANTNKTLSATYPKSNDDSVENTGKAIDSVTRKYEYTTTDFNHSAITEGVITIASPTTGSKVLCHFSFGGAFEKTTSDTLTVYINHNFNGV